MFGRDVAVSVVIIVLSDVLMLSAVSRAFAPAQKDIRQIKTVKNRLYI